jgi:Fur family ferric uptake transcriptional regulator
MVQARSTNQRTAVRELLDRIEGFHTAQELHAMLRSSGTPVGLTTAYRTLQAFADAGEVDVMRRTPAERVAAEHGFVDVSHTFDLFGTRRDCR